MTTFWIMANKYDLFIWTMSGFSYFLRIREGYKSAVTHSRDDCWQVQSLPSELERAWHWEEPSWEPATANLAYSIAGLVTITQFPLVHRMLQGVEHTDPTEWSNSHLSIGDKFVLTVLRAIDSFFRQCSFSFQTAPQYFISDGSATFHFRRLRNISFQTAPQYFIIMGFVRKWL